MGAPQHHGFRFARPVVLAHEAGFVLGALQVDPPHRQVRSGDRRETLEPRVMQVLVALARAGGEIVTRDELIQACWDGRIVGDDSVNRVLSRIRRLAADVGGASFAIETIPRVGYRLHVDGRELERGTAVEAAAPYPSLHWLPRRRFIAGLGAAGAAAAGGGYWLSSRSRQADPRPEALALYRKATEAQRDGAIEQNVQAVADLENAVAIDPEFADAWGALAVAYSQLIDNKPITDMQQLEERSRAAASRALELDPGNARARIALVLTHPTYRSWALVEPDLRRLMRAYPDEWIVPAALGRLLYDVGRIEEGLAAFRRALAINPFLPGAAAWVGFGLWAAGRVQEAERHFTQSAARWPSHYGLWFSRFNFLAYSGRANAAVGMVDEALASPLGLPRDLLANAALAAEALLTREESRIASAADAITNGPADQGVYFLATVGLVDRAFARAWRYCTREWWPDGPRPVGPQSRRYPAFLFAPPTSALRADRRFEQLVRSTRLADYWRATGTLPDYRR